MEDVLSFSQVMTRLRAADNDAATQVFGRFTRRLVALARGQLGVRVRQKLDPEDVVQSVYHSFFRRHVDGELDVADWDGLWGLLALMTLWKCRKRVRDLCRAVRDVRRERPLLPPADQSGPSCEAIADDPTPSEAAILIETTEAMMRGLDERDREIVSLRLQGYTEEEIARQVRLSERSVRRVLSRVKKRLERIRAT